MYSMSDIQALDYFQKSQSYKDLSVLENGFSEGIATGRNIELDFSFPDSII